ncbi:unnamed protein product [Rhizophagus irregularis]|nr:unnamed protein product [Rhizophagus irregularis]
MDADIPAPTWMPIFQGISSNMDADIPGILVPMWIPNPKDKDISSGVNTESHWETVSTWIPNPIEKSVLPFLQKIGSSVDTDISGKVSKNFQNFIFFIKRNG